MVPCCVCIDTIALALFGNMIGTGEKLVGPIYKIVQEQTPLCHSMSPAVYAWHICKCLDKTVRPLYMYKVKFAIDN